MTSSAVPASRAVRLVPFSGHNERFSEATTPNGACALGNNEPSGAREVRHSGWRSGGLGPRPGALVGFLLAVGITSAGDGLDGSADHIARDIDYIAGDVDRSADHSDAGVDHGSTDCGYGAARKGKGQSNDYDGGGGAHDDFPKNSFTQQRMIDLF